MRAIVTSSFLYGCETWTLTREWERKINAFELRCYRRLLGIPYTAHRSNQSVLNEIEQTAGPFDRLLETVNRRKLTWFGHVIRANNLTTITLQASVPADRGRGRPRTSWFANILEWTGMDINDLLNAAKDRARWRKIAYKASRERAPTTNMVTG